MLKNLLRDLWHNKARFLAIVAIVAIGSAFFAGIRAACPDMKETADLYFKDSNFFDLRVTALGLTPDDVALISRVEGVESVSPGYCVDALTEENQNEYVLKVYSLPGSSQNPPINQPEVLEGRLPENDGECAVEQKVVDLTGKTIGDTMTLYNSQGRIHVTISGIIHSPSLYLAGTRRQYAWQRGSQRLFICNRGSGTGAVLSSDGNPERGGPKPCTGGCPGLCHAAGIHPCLHGDRRPGHDLIQ
jgi:hypothetical protein